MTILISARKEGEEGDEGGGEAASSQAPTFAVRKQGALMAEKSEISAFPLLGRKWISLFFFRKIVLTPNQNQ